MPDLSTAALLESLRAHANRRALESLVRNTAIDATLARRADFASRHRIGAGPAVGPGHIPEGLSRADAETPYGNVLDVLERGVERLEERLLLGALMALSLESEAPSDSQSAVELGFHLVWLSANTPCDALLPLDDAIGASAADIWYGVALVVSAPESVPMDFGPTEALVAAAALRRSLSPDAQALRFECLGRVLDPALHALLVPAPGEFESALTGEAQPAPRGPVVTALFALTLLLFVINAVRLVGKYVFAYRTPAALRLGPEGLELVYRVELMGQVLRNRSILVPLANIARVTREIRYARLGLYAGLVALTVGTYFGTGLFVDAVRVPGGSAPLLGLAALFVLIGLGADFVLSTGADSAKGKCRLIVTPVKGRALCIGGLDPQDADALLRAVAEQTRAVTTEPPPAAPAEAAPDTASPATDASA